MAGRLSRLELVRVTDVGRDAVKSLSVRPNQERFVASAEKSLADADAYEEAVIRVAVVEGDPVGYVLLFPFDSERGRTVNVVRLMIDQHHQARGLGRELLSAALELARTFEPRVDVVRISTLPQNEAALSLYESVGFERTGIEEGEVALYKSLD